MTLQVFQEKGAFIAYCPKLDLSTCGDTPKEAVRNFREMLQLHIEVCKKKGTLKQDMAKHGIRI